MEEIKTEIEQLTRLLSETTPSAVLHFRVNCQARGMLFGKELLRFHQRLAEADSTKKGVMERAYGLYFIFFETSATLVPVYVGKGDLPYRLLQHFGLVAPVDQVLAFHLGGLHGYPQHLRDKEKYQKGLERLHVGVVLACRNRSNDDVRKKVDKYEKYLIKALKPVADGSNYNYERYFDFKKGEFDLQTAADEWAVTPKNAPTREFKVEYLKQLQDQFLAKR